MSDAAEKLKQLLSNYGVHPESYCGAQMQAYLALLEKWNSTINLTSTTDWSGIGPLFQEAVAAAAFYADHPQAHLDIGSGGGFPAIPLRIMRPQICLEMVESRGKRCVFLETAAATLKIGECRIHNARLNTFLENISHDKVWDCISWKALKLGSRDLAMLRDHAHPDTEFWMFHGKEPAVEEPIAFEKHFRCSRREKLSVDRDWHLSVYRVI